jgi:hypothetical protein
MQKLSPFFYDINFFAKYIKSQVCYFSYQVEHIIYGNLEVFYFFDFFYHFLLFFTSLKGHPREGGVLWLEKDAIIPDALGKVRRG